MEAYLPISFLNDFIFCPRSIYFHQLYGRTSNKFYHKEWQTEGINAHRSIDTQNYSTKKSILQGKEIYSEKYKLCGKIDLYDADLKVLTERKRTIKIVYDGYIFQLYAQYFCLTEMGYEVKKIKLYSMSNNKNHYLTLPQQDLDMLARFEKLITQIKLYDLNQEFIPNRNKCQKCVYNHLCDMSLAH